MKRTELLIILTLFGILFLASVDNQLLIPLLPVLASDLEVGVAELGRLFSLYALSAALFNLWAGPLTDRYGRLPFLRGGLAAFVLLSFAIYASSAYWQLLLLRAGAGFAAGILSTCVASFVGDHFPYRRRGKVMGLVLSSYFLALVAGIPLAVFVAETWSWRVIFVASAGFAGALLVAAFLFLRTPAGGPAEVDRSPIWKRYLFLVRSPERSGALLTSFLVSGGTLSFLTYISGLGFSPTETAQLFMVAGLAALGGSPLAGWLSDRIGKRPVFLLSNSAMGVALPMILWLEWGAPLFVVFFTVTLFVAARQTSLQTVQTELISTAGRGTFIALRNAASQLGIALCVLLSGVLFSQFGYTAVVFLASGLTLLASLVFLLFIPEPAE